MIFKRATWRGVRLEVIKTKLMILNILYNLPSASSDYTAINRSLVFNGATRSQIVTVSIRDDMAVENQFERFFINLSNYWYESAVILSQPTASVTIEDNNDSEFSLQYTNVCMCTRMSIFKTSFLPQRLQLDSMEPTQCVKMLVALVLLYLF